MMLLYNTSKRKIFTFSSKLIRDFTLPLFEVEEPPRRWGLRGVICNAALLS
jgi:hypothetical protein